MTENSVSEMKQKNRREKKRRSKRQKKCYRPLVSLEVERPKGKKMEEAKKKSNRNGDPVSGASNLFPSPALGSFFFFFFFFFFFLFLSLSLSVVTFFSFSLRYTEMLNDRIEVRTVSPSSSFSATKKERRARTHTKMTVGGGK